MEQTAYDRPRPWDCKKHLHMRGANLVTSVCRGPSLETSPHAWSKPQMPFIADSDVRNISTCVEQTPEDFKLYKVAWKHLHMRGANVEVFLFLVFLLETSPHAWSKLVKPTSQSRTNRNISTCVEQTPHMLSMSTGMLKHLHMRGANCQQRQAM